MSRDLSVNMKIHRPAVEATGAFPLWPIVDEQQIEAVAAVLRSGKLSAWTGDECRLFEREFAEAFGCRYAVALANGTVALELALHALGIGPGDDVVVTCRSFIASASCCVSRGARPVFADVDRNSQNVTAETILAALTPRTRAVIAVHLAGWPCEMEPILELAARRGLWVIEDCAQAHGATYRGRPVGSLGHAAAFSFCQDKILTTGGEGGMLTTNDPLLWERAWSYKDHGKSPEAVARPSATVFKWLHESFGTNWRMTEMQAALGRVALRRLPQWVLSRRHNAAVLTERLGCIPALRIPVPPNHLQHSYYKFYAFLRPERLSAGWSRDRIVREMQTEGIPCGSGICPEIYQEQAFAGTDLRPAARLFSARQLGETSLMLLVHPTLTDDHLHRTCDVLESVLQKAIRKTTGRPSRAA